MPEIQGPFLIILILCAIVGAGVHKVKDVIHYHDRPKIGCVVAGQTTLCWHDERDTYLHRIKE